MVDPFSESELLEFIEDQLAPRRVASLRRRLADHPEIEAMVDQLLADRRLLRTTSEPALPLDFVTELEPQLARAAVTTSVPETAPGAYRRRHRRAAHRNHAREVERRDDGADADWLPNHQLVNARRDVL